MTTINSPVPFSLTWPTGQQSLAIRTDANFDPARLAKMLQIPIPTRLLMLSGGAGDMSLESHQKLKRLFQAIAEVLAATQTTVIDGGTKFGAVSLLGEALAHTHYAAPYIGVLPAHAETSPNGPKGEEVLEPHHSHFVLIEGKEWGEEVRLMYGLADYFSRQATSVALLVNGGSISLKEVEQNVQQHREIIIIAGSGRLADELAAAVHQPQAAMRDRVATVVRAGKLTIFDLSQPVETLATLLKQRLKSKA
ncbi:MAG: hypothetical protein MUF72_19905 [Elainella sp. Prado103]|nr:hypothetical protein [Elainella sp. Prado103]